MWCVAASAGSLVCMLGLCSGAFGSDPTLDPPDTPSFRVKLTPFVVPPACTGGLVAKVRLNGGAALHLLLDSGAGRVVLTRRAALKSRCTGAGDLDAIGPGVASPATVKQLRADTLEIGDLTLRDIPVLIADSTMPGGIDGVMPLSLFAGFLIRLDMPGKNLDFLPYPPEEMSSEGALLARSSNQLLFVEGVVNDRRRGYFLVDTGSWYGAISREVSRDLRLSEALAPRVALQGWFAQIDAPLFTGFVRLRFGSSVLATAPTVVVDLSTTSRYHGFEICGLIGYTNLAKSILVINYRDGLVRIANSR